MMLEKRKKLKILIQFLVTWELIYDFIIQENIKKIKEGKINNKCLSAHVKNSGSNNSIRSNKSIENEKTNSNNFGKNSFIVNENINVNSFENCKSYSKGKKLNDDKKIQMYNERIFTKNKI